MSSHISQRSEYHALQCGISCIAMLGVMIISGLGNVSGADQQTILHRTAITPSPKVENGRITYQIDLTFNQAPADFLTYYEPKKGAIILDIYGIGITSKTAALPRNLIFKSLRIENIASTMALSGKKAQIILGADPGWQIATTAQGDTILSISVSRMLNLQSEGAQAFPWHQVVFGVANALAVAASWVVISLLPQAPR